jgi:predicted NBD/HSP70 family sugar kinase
MRTSTSTGVVAGLDFGGTKLDVAVASPTGELLGRRRLETDAARGAEQAVERALEAVHELIDDAEREHGRRCVAAGAVTPGIVHDDRVLLAPNVPGWGDLALPALLRDAFGTVPVVVETDVKAATLAEARWGALQGADPGIFLGLGTGIAAGIVVGGHVLAGANGAAGEIGYDLLHAGDDGAAAGRAPLEELAGGRAIGDRASALLGRPVAAEEAFALAATEPAVAELVDEALSALALHVANMAVLIDPARIAVGGGLMGSGERILGALDASLRAAVPFPPELVSARFLHDAPLRGALALAGDAAADGDRRR